MGGPRDWPGRGGWCPPTPSHHPPRGFFADFCTFCNFVQTSNSVCGACGGGRGNGGGGGRGRHRHPSGPIATGPLPSIPSGPPLGAGGPWLCPPPPGHAHGGAPPEATPSPALQRRHWPVRAMPPGEGAAAGQFRSRPSPPGIRGVSIMGSASCDWLPGTPPPRPRHSSCRRLRVGRASPLVCCDWAMWQRVSPHLSSSYLLSVPPPPARQRLSLA